MGVLFNNRSLKGRICAAASGPTFRVTTPDFDVEVIDAKNVSCEVGSLSEGEGLVW